MSRRILITLVALVFAALLSSMVVIVLSRDDEPARPATVTTKVDTLDGSPDKDKTIVVPREAVEQAEAALSGSERLPAQPLSPEDADHTNSRDETPENIPEPLLDANRAALDFNRRTTTALPTAGATGGFKGCVTSFVRNQSGRRGVRPTVQVLHYTVSANRPGRSDVNSITAYFNNSSSQASSHFVIDADGNCNYIVPIEAKAWTQAGGNPWAVSYEIIATGRERNYLNPAGYAKLRSVMREVSRRTGIPLRAGRISGCAPSRSGSVEHADGGICWGGHHDIGPFSLAAVLAKVTSDSRASSLRTRNRATHKSLRDRRCAPSARTRSEACKTLHRRHAALHAAAKREGVRL